MKNIKPIIFLMYKSAIEEKRIKEFLISMNGLKLKLIYAVSSNKITVPEVISLLEYIANIESRIYNSNRALARSFIEDIINFKDSNQAKIKR
jgi:hypothetical protein